MATPTHCPQDVELQDLLADKLSQQAQSLLAEHIEICADCRRRLDALADGENLLPQAAAPAGDEPGDGLSELVERLKAAGPAPEPVATAAMDPITERPGAMIGRYKLLQKIGEGGMGTVFMAEQTEPIKRRVALKIIKHGLDTRQFIARFEAERQALAMMDHANIAHVLDAGCTEGGRPYFVMELVKGVPLLKFCDENRLTAAERLKLFAAVCEAVQHAHQRGIIHRDLKPSNVLVALYDDRPVPKIIDFGLAKATHQQLTEKTLFTQIGQIVGTWEYMSPEQAVLNQLDVDTRTDVYSLGVMLYELLTGVTPLEGSRLRSAAFDEVLRLIREEEPPKPSTRVSSLGQSATSAATYRGTNVAALTKTLRGDLDWIVMKALEKNRSRRYDTAQHLADDIQRYLAHEPVEARAPSTLYRLQKLVRRHRVGAIAVALVAASFLGATVFSSWMWYRERQTSAREREALRALAVQEAEVRSERDKARKAADDAGLALEIIATTLGGGEGERLGSPDETAFQVLDRLAKQLDASEEPNFFIEANIRPVLARAYYSAGNHPAAEAQYRLAVTAQRKAYGEVSPKLADTLHFFAVALSNIGKATEGEECAREGMRIWQALGDEQRATSASGQIVHALRRQGKLQEALVIAEQSLPILRQTRGDASPVTAWCLYEAAECSGGMGDYARSLTYLTEAMAVFERIGNVDGQWLIAMRTGRALSALKEFTEAKNAFTLALRLAEQQGVQRVQRRHESALSLCSTLFTLGDYPSAAQVHRQILELPEEELARKDPRRVEHLVGLVAALTAQDKDAEAEPLKAEALAALDAAGQCRFWLRLGQLHRSHGRVLNAEESTSEAMKLWEKLGPEEIELRKRAAEQLADIFCELKDFGKAADVSRRFIEFAKGKLPDDDGRVLYQLYCLTFSLDKLGKTDEARATRSLIAAAFAKARQENRKVWGPRGDLLCLAECLAMGTEEPAGIEEAIRILDEIRSETDKKALTRQWWNAIAGEIASRQGRLEDAVRHNRAQVADLEPHGLTMRSFVRPRLVELLCQSQHHDEAEAVLREALDETAKKYGDEHVFTDYARIDLAELLVAQEKLAEAETLLTTAERHFAAEARVPEVQKQHIYGLMVNLYTCWDKPDQAAVWREKLSETAAH